MASVFSSNKWISSPTGYWTIGYEYKRSGANMLYRFSWKVWLGSSTSYYNNKLQLQLFLNGSQKNVTVKGSTTSKGWSYEGTTEWYTVSNKTSGTTPFYARIYDTSTSTVKATSSTYALAISPAYPSVAQSLGGKTETSIGVNWSSDSAIDKAWYSLNNGSSWEEIGVISGKSGAYEIMGLKANTTYQIKTRVRGKDNQLTSDSSALSVTTYNYPHCTTSPDFTIGDKVTLKFYNPLGRTFKFKIIANGTEIAAEYNCSSTSYSGVNSLNSSVPQLYATIPDSQSGKYKVKVIYEDSTLIYDNGNTFKIKGTEVPIPGTLSYADTNEETLELTQNPLHIIQEYSRVLVTYGEATGCNSATIKSYTFTLWYDKITSTDAGGTVDFGRIYSATDTTLTMTVTDSRGLSSSISIPVTMIPYRKPTFSVSLTRLNNYEDETYLIVDADVDDINGNNSITEILYWYSANDGSSIPRPTTISNKTKVTLTTDKNKDYTFHIQVSDKLSAVGRDVPLSKGIFPFFINTERNSVGINDFPQEGEALRVKGLSNFLDEPKVKERMFNDWLYPVGYVCITDTNTSPSEIYGGTWELIDKEFADMQVIEKSDYYYFTPIVGGDYEIHITRSGHSMTISGVLNGFTNGSLDDTNEVLGSFYFSYLGVTAFPQSNFFIGFSDSGKVGSMLGLLENGKLQHYDVLSGTTLESGGKLAFSTTLTFTKEYMLDSACNKFYWKRTA